MQTNSTVVETLVVRASRLAGILFLMPPVRHLMTCLERQFSGDLKCQCS